MNILFADSASSLALWIVLKASALLALTAIVQMALRTRASAATRHHLWTIALAVVLLLPAASSGLPALLVPVRSAVAAVPVVQIAEPSDAAALQGPAAPAETSEASVSPVPPVAAVSWSVTIALVYIAGAAGMLLYLLLQQWRVRRFARRATPVSDDEWMRLLAECAGRMGVDRHVHLLRSRERSVPMTFGTWAPSIVMPAVADTWPDERRTAVLLHELAHVARLDCLTQLMASAACAMYWFHPASWWVARRLRVERELACDDRVIAAGTEPRDYAGHLLEIAYSLGGHRAPAMAVTMARRSQLEGRLLAALDAARNRSVPAYRARVAGAALAAALLSVVAAARLTVVAAQPEPATVTAAAIRTTDARQEPETQPTLAEGVVTGVVQRVARVAAGAIARAQSAGQGTWEIRPSKTEGEVNLRLVEFNSSWGSNVPIDRLEGLTRANLTGATGQIVQFRLRRDAGTFTFEGVFRNGAGAGTFAFAADQNFPAELAKRGLARPTSAEQYDMARADVGFAFLDELTAQGYSKPQTSEIVQAAHHGVRAPYVRDMGALGYRLGSLPALITLRDHGVTPDYVRELQANGYKGLSADDLRRARDHGVSAEYVQAMREAGYGSLSMDVLINARDHGISAEYIKGMRDAGYTSLSLDALVKARDHGISVEYIRGMRDAGYGSLTLETLVNARDHGVGVEYVRQLGDAGFQKLPLEEVIRVRDHGVSAEYVRDMRQLGFTLPLNELVRARDHGVSVEFVREMTALGYKGMTMDGLIRLKDHGVTPQYVRDLKALGYDTLALDDMVTLRDHGLSAERIKSANARAGTRLPIDLLKSLASGGWR
jgi:beta-lactamase regulating signal transducer with metallopeptidase domain